MGLVVLSGLCAWVLLATCGRLVRLIAAPWQDAVRSGLPSLRLMLCTLLLLVCAAPFLWHAAEVTATPEFAITPASDIASVSASLPALFATWVAAAVMIIAFGNLLFRVARTSPAIAGEVAG